MSSLGGLIVTFSSFLCVLLVLVLIHKLWWTPKRIQKGMASQGIKGPPYKLIHGNTKQVTKMINEVTSRPKKFSHDTFSVAQPHIHTWIKLYGNQQSGLVNYCSAFLVSRWILVFLSTGKTYLEWHGSQGQLVITEPELCKEILNNKERAYPKQSKLMGDGIVTTIEVEKWSKKKKKN